MPVRLEPVETTPPDYRASTEILSAGDLEFVEAHYGPAAARWQGRAARDRLHLVINARSAGGAGSCNDAPMPLSRGYAAILGRTDGWWRAPGGLRRMQLSLPRAAVPVAIPAPISFRPADWPPSATSATISPIPACHLMLWRPRCTFPAAASTAVFPASTESPARSADSACLALMRCCTTHGGWAPSRTSPLRSACRTPPTSAGSSAPHTVRAQGTREPMPHGRQIPADCASRPHAPHPFRPAPRRDTAARSRSAGPPPMWCPSARSS